MTNAESNLYNLLTSEPTRVFTKEEIVKSVFPDHQQEDIPLGIGAGPTRLVDQTAISLRERLQADSPHLRRVINVWGIGYRFRD